MTETPFKDALMEYLKTENITVRADVLARSEGGYLLPSHVKEPRKGILGYFARLIKHDYGWVEYAVFDVIKNQITQVSVISKVKL